jgi:hypothetical protein
MGSISFALSFATSSTDCCGLTVQFCRHGTIKIIQLMTRTGFLFCESRVMCRFTGVLWFLGQRLKFPRPEVLDDLFVFSFGKLRDTVIESCPVCEESNSQMQRNNKITERTTTWHAGQVLTLNDGNLMSGKVALLPRCLRHFNV